jgi:Kdo2-lipid IVA lauroyltransferase/acyltransferase
LTVTASKKNRLIHEGAARRIEFGLYRIITVPIVSFLPAVIAYGIACFRGDAVYRIDKKETDRIRRGVEAILGNSISQAEREGIVREWFRLRSCEAIDVMRLAQSRRGSRLTQLVEIRGVENIRAALENGKGAILCSGHFGSYETCFSLLALQGIPVTVIRRLPHPSDHNRTAAEYHFARIFLRITERPHYRLSIEPRSGEIGAAFKAVYYLRRNEVIGTFVDSLVRDPDRARARSVSFLGGRALLLRGIIDIAKHTGAPILMVFQRRSPDWRHQVLEIYPPLQLESNTEEDLEKCVAKLETEIRNHPAHWHYWIFEALERLNLVQDSRTSTPLPESLPKVSAGADKKVNSPS